jgi:hypothetical protein
MTADAEDEDWRRFLDDILAAEGGVISGAVEETLRILFVAEGIDHSDDGVLLATYERILARALKNLAKHGPN